MTCHDVGAALVEDRLPRSPELQRHLEGCEGCREVAALHASASALRLPAPPSLAPVTREAVLGEVRRRRLRRRATAGAVASLCLGGLLPWLRPPAPPVPVDEAPLEASYAEVEHASGTELGLRRSEEDVPSGTEADTARAVLAGRGSLLQLMGEVRGFTRRDLAAQDESYRPFGTLAAWVRPPDSRALETPPFRTAVMPLYSQESYR